jgi:hypothetical protein
MNLTERRPTSCTCPAFHEGPRKTRPVVCASAPPHVRLIRDLQRGSTLRTPSRARGKEKPALALQKLTEARRMAPYIAPTPMLAKIYSALAEPASVVIVARVFQTYARRSQSADPRHTASPASRNGLILRGREALRVASPGLKSASKSRHLKQSDDDRSSR